MIERIGRRLYAIADWAPYLFCIIWGMGAGAFGAVFFRAVSVSEQTLQSYLTVLVAIMTGILALTSTRAMDSLGDRRKRKRRLVAGRARIRQLLRAIYVFEESLDRVNDAMEGRSGDIDANLAHDLVTAAQRISGASRSVPDMEDLIDGSADIEQLERMALIFDGCQDATSWVGATLEKHSRLELLHAAQRLRRIDTRETVTQLTDVDRYFAARFPED